MRTGQSIIVQDRGATLAHWSLLPAHDSPQGWRTLALFHSTFNLFGLQCNVHPSWLQFCRTTLKTGKERWNDSVTNVQEISIYAKFSFIHLEILTSQFIYQLLCNAQREAPLRLFDQHLLCIGVTFYILQGHQLKNIQLIMFIIFVDCFEWIWNSSITN